MHQSVKLAWMRLKSTTFCCQQVDPALAERLGNLNVILAVTFSYGGRIMLLLWPLVFPQSRSWMRSSKVLPVIDCAGSLSMTQKLNIESSWGKLLAPNSAAALQQMRYPLSYYNCRFFTGLKLSINVQDVLSPVLRWHGSRRQCI